MAKKSGQPGAREQEQAAAAWADFQKARRWRLNLDLLWYVLTEQYKGNADIFYDPPTGHRGAEIYRVQSNRPRSQRIRVANLMGHAIDIGVAKRMRVRPVPHCIPNSSSDKAVATARASTDLLRHWWRSQRFTTRRRDLFLDAHITGSGFIGVQYDHFAGPFVDQQTMKECPRCNGTALDPENWEMRDMGMGAQRVPAMCGACQGQGQVLGETKRKPLGDVTFPLIRPWELYPDPSARSIEDANHVFRAFRLRPDQVRARFPWMEKEEIRPSVAIEEAESSFARQARDYRYEAPDDYAWVVEQHMPPLPGEDQPRIRILAGNRVVWPQPDDKEGCKEGFVRRRERVNRIPIYHFRTRPNPENFWPYGLAQDMLSASDTVNRGRDIQHRHLTQMVNSKWFVARGSIPHDALTTDTGEVVEYEDGAERPYSDRPAPLQEMAERLIEREGNRIYELGWVHDLDRGVPPKNIEAAEALEILVEQGGAAFGPLITADNETFEDVFFAGLCCAKANYKAGEERFVQVGGEGSEMEARALDGAAISTELVVRVESGSAINDNLALKRNHILALYKEGLITDPRQVLQEMEFGLGDADYTDDRRLQEAAAMKENEDMAKGAEHQVTPGVDDHEIHASIHRRAAVRAKIKGDMETFQRAAMAAVEHMQQLAADQQPQQAPAPAGGNGTPQPAGAVPFDAMPTDAA